MTLVNRHQQVEEKNSFNNNSYTNMKVFVMLVVGSLAVVWCKAAPHKAHSFQHFHGPVEGDGVEETWKDKHGHEDVDYKAHPKYEFSYGVKDHHTKDFHGQKEHRDGKDVAGEYTLHEPGGNVRTVKYHADHHGGFHAVVHNSGGNDHSGGTYGGLGHS
ncbi:uncharacterized protein LOC122854533 [Aphidius gifuensis]|uniref:uncharacterized protein LOC122854533 n=1 Tax=Aphidius gifuensis TaxID=684658 RepID=UPI001CDB651E|nr:uncharacterized protein LOC122854533 [Aphidius gifuensis]